MDQTAPKEAALSETFSPARKERARLWFEHLRDEIMSRIIVEPRRKGLFVTIRKGAGF